MDNVVATWSRMCSVFGLCLLTTVFALAPSARAASVEAENLLSGDSNWTAYKHLAPASVIEGYTSESSVAPGGLVHFHVNSPASSYRIEVSRLGWYAGAGGRTVACIPGCSSSEGPVTQSNTPIVDSTTGELDANWTVTDTLEVGEDWATGYYVAEFLVTSGEAAGKVAWYPIIVTPPPGDESVVLVQVPTNTWQAYNPWPGAGVGKSLYGFMSSEGEAATKVSFNRPLTQRGTESVYYQDPVFGREIQAVRFLEREGYEVAYVTDGDVDRDPGLLLDHRLDLALGHDEYWSAAMRNGWEGTLAAGHNEVFMGADIGTWMVRFEDAGRTLVGYKYNPDPVSPPTTLFRKQDPPEPECELEGVQYDEAAGHAGLFGYTVTASAATNPWLEAAGLAAGDEIPASVGYEWDAVTPGCSTPPLEVLFHLPSTGTAGSADAVTYEAPGGGTVFSTGTNMFANMLDDYNDATSKGQAADPRIQVFANALLAELAAAPIRFELEAGATGSGSGTITSSPGGIDCGEGCFASFPWGTAVTLTATAAPGSYFGGWSGSDCSGVATCTVSMYGARSVSADFELEPQIPSPLDSGGARVPSANSACGTPCAARPASPLRSKDLVRVLGVGKRRGRWVVRLEVPPALRHKLVRAAWKVAGCRDCGKSVRVRLRFHTTLVSSRLPLRNKTTFTIDLPAVTVAGATYERSRLRLKLQ
jgi:hypothetical protein